MGLKGSKTEKNLLASFAGESQARNRYTFYAGIASKEGFEGIANIFLETADNEKKHARGNRRKNGRGGRSVESPAPRGRDAFYCGVSNFAFSLAIASRPAS